MDKVELIYAMRLLLSALIGFIIGVERKMRSKEAGMRTHAMVCLGACLFMLISKYGFSDVDTYDASRIASQVVAGVGFLGAGMILYRKHSIHGLTTAAGIWATAGIGMAIGCGLYIVAISATIVMMIVLLLLCLPINFLRTPDRPIVKVVFECNEREDETLKSIFNIKDFDSCEITRKDEMALYTAYFSLPQNIDESALKNILLENKFIKQIEKNQADRGNLV